MKSTMQDLVCSSGNLIISIGTDIPCTTDTSATTSYRTNHKRDKRSYVPTKANSEQLIYKNLTSLDVLDVACVYLLFREYKVVYVGQSRNFYSRIQSHKKTKDFTHFRCLRCHPQRLDYWEGKLIFEYKPEYNKRGINSREGDAMPFGIYDGKPRKLRGVV